MFADLDKLEKDLQKRMTDGAVAAEHLKLVQGVRKLLGATKAKSPLQSPAAKKKQLAASKAYWAGVKAGTIKRKGYKATK